MPQASSVPADQLPMEEVLDIAASPSSSSAGPSGRGGLRRIEPTAALVAAFYLAGLTTLVATVAVGVMARGWTPVVVASAPAVDGLRTGDVVLVGRSGADSASAEVVAVRAGGVADVRRSHPGVEDDVFITVDGRRPDRLAPVDADIVVGVGRLVVPLIGLPRVWLANGQYGLLGIWIGVTVSAALLTAGRFGQRLARRRRLGRNLLGLSPPLAAAQRQLAPVRLATAVVIVLDLVLRPAAHQQPALGLPAYGPTLLAILTLVALARYDRLDNGRDLIRSWALPLIGWVAVLLLVTVVGVGGPLWLAVALPMVEGTVLAGVTGAATAWTATAVGATIVRLALVGAGGDRVVHQNWADHTVGLVAVGLVVGPLAIAAERLIRHLEHEQRRLAAATTRTSLLTELARAGYRMSRLGQLQIETIVEATLALGFDAADIVESTNGSDWEVLAAGGEPDLPVPGAPGSGLRRSDLQHPGVAVDRLSGDDLDRSALDQAGLGAVLVQRVTKRIGRTVVVRAAIRGADRAEGARVASFQMLAGQAAIAFQNSDLLSELQATRDDLQHRANHDPLTGLPNRQLLLTEATAELQGPEARPALLFCDLDGFKPVNDRLGHETGDALLGLVAQRLRAVAPPDAVVSRIGGDEFTILLCGQMTDELVGDLATEVWQRLREPFELQGNLIHVSTSVGVAFGRPGLEPAEFIRRADVAMYEAKSGRSGTPPFLIYQPEFDREANRRASLAVALGQALIDAEVGASGLHLQYQPVFRLRPPTSLLGVESLLRWNHELHGDISPEEIIEVAQASGQQAILNRFVVDEACRQVALWAGQFEAVPFVVSINASAAEVASGDLGRNLEAALLATGAPPERILVEVSQRIRKQDLGVVTANLERLVALGVGIVIDDFGRGASSLSFLHELPLTSIKLDRSLVVSSLSSEADAVLCESLLALARRLGVYVVAEGIESAEHLELMRGLGCSMGQGHHLGRPGDTDSATAALATEADRLRSELATTADAAGAGGGAQGHRGRSRRGRR